MSSKGQHLFEIYPMLSSVLVASYTSQTLPCLNTKQVAVKAISKVQQTLSIFDLLYQFLPNDKKNEYSPPLAKPTPNTAGPKLVSVPK